MLFLILAIVLINGQVHAFNIPYPIQRSTVPLAYNYGQLPAQGSIVQGFIRYFDNNGIERVIRYSYPKPKASGPIQTFEVAQTIPSLQSSLQQQQQHQANTLIWEKAREAHFRAWSWQQYQALKREIDALRSQGKQPSIDMLAKYQPLEKIALTTDFNTIAELPDVRRIHNEHSNIWQQGVTKSQMVISNDQHQQQNAQTYEVNIKQAESSNKSDDNQEHLRLWSEAKVQPEQQEQQKNQQQDQEQHQEHITENFHQSIQIPQTVYKTEMIDQETSIPNRMYLESISQQKPEESIEYQLKHQQGHTANVDGIIYLTDTPEVQKAREEHLRIFNSIKAHVEHKNQYEHAHEYEQSSEYGHEHEQQQQEQQQPQGQQHQMIPMDVSKTENDQISDGLDNVMALSPDDSNIEKLREAERKQSEENFLQMENIREAQRLQEQQQQLELEKQQEIERLMAEKRQMDDELMRLHLEDMKRLQIDRIQEAKRLKQDEEQIKQQLNQQQYEQQFNIEETLKTKPMLIENDRQPQKQYITPVQNTGGGIPSFTATLTPTIIPTIAPTSYIQQSSSFFPSHISHGSNTAAAIYPATYSYIKSKTGSIEPNAFGIGAGQQKFTYYILPISPVIATATSSGGIGSGGFSNVAGISAIGSPIQYVPFITQGKSLMSAQSLPSSSLASPEAAAVVTAATTATTKATKLEPITKDYGQNVAKDLDELAKAKGEHFEAYNKALKQLSTTAAANSSVGINTNANANIRNTDTILPFN